MHVKDCEGRSIVFYIVFFFRYTDAKLTIQFPASQRYIPRGRGGGQRRTTNEGEKNTGANMTRNDNGDLSTPVITESIIVQGRQ